MKAKLYIYIIMLMVLISCRYSQNKSLDSFNSQVKNYNERINRNDIFNIEDKLTMIKLFNSIHEKALPEVTLVEHGHEQFIVKRAKHKWIKKHS